MTLTITPDDMVHRWPKPDPVPMTRAQLRALLVSAAREGLGAGWDGCLTPDWEGFMYHAHRIAAAMMPPARTLPPRYTIPASQAVGNVEVTVSYERDLYVMGALEATSAAAIAYHMVLPASRDAVVLELLALKSCTAGLDPDESAPVSRDAVAAVLTTHQGDA